MLLYTRLEIRWPIFSHAFDSWSALTAFPPPPPLLLPERRMPPTPAGPTPASVNRALAVLALSPDRSDSGLDEVT
jgi:hypothetical protein